MIYILYITNNYNPHLIPYSYYTVLHNNICSMYIVYCITYNVILQYTINTVWEIYALSINNTNSLKIINIFTKYLC